MKVGISVRIDVTKIDKARFFKGEKGTYMDLTTFIDMDQKDQYSNNGFISQSVSKEERAQGVQTPILGNVKVFYNDQGANTGQISYQQQQPNGGYANQPQQNQQQPNPRDFQAPPDFDDDIPF